MCGLLLASIPSDTAQLRKLIRKMHMAAALNVASLCAVCGWCVYNGSSVIAAVVVLCSVAVSASAGGVSV